MDEPQDPSGSPPTRILPTLTDLDRPFWTGGAGGSLLVQRCGSCRRWAHPPVAVCATCGGAMSAEPVAGTGTVFTYTVNHQQFHPEVPPPYIIAIVVLDEQDDLRLAANIVHCEPSALACGLPVRVVFEQQGEVYVPLFEPVT